MGATTVVPQDAPPVSIRFRYGGGLPAILSGVSVAGRLHLSSMRAQASLRIGESAPPPMRQVPTPGFADVRDYSSSDEDSADLLVLGGLPDDY